MLREKRDKMIVKLAEANWPERVIGANGGVAGSYVNQLKKRANQKVVTR